MIEPSTTEHWDIRKPAVHNNAGIVASQHYRASQTGADILNAGGNAIDAAIATSLMIGTVEPWMSGLGGGGFMLYYEKARDTVHSIEFGMRATQGLNPADYPLVEGADNDLFAWPAVQDNRNVYGPLSIAVPGYLRGIGSAVENFASLSLPELLQPAIDSAKSGFDVDWYATLKIAAAAPGLAEFPQSARCYLPHGFVPAGEWGGPLPSIKLGNLAATLERIRDYGVDDFYRGELATSIVTDCQATGCPISAADMAAVTASIGTADHGHYRDAHIFTAPGLSAGPTLQDALARMSASDWLPGTQPDRHSYACYANSLRDSYAQRLATLGDIDDSIAPGCTTHISVVDSAGNMVALTQTLLSVFGSKLMLPGSGILMNNGVMWFDPRPGQPNSLGPGKRPLSNMCPTMCFDASGNQYALGASGGRRIMPAVMQLLSMLIDHEMTIEQAMHQPRIDVSGGNQTTVDAKLAPNISAHLQQLGHNTAIAEHGIYPAMYGCPNVVTRQSNGENQGSAFVMSPWATAVPEK